METVRKVLSIINLLTKEPAGVQEISKQLNIGKSSVSRTMAALVSEGWVKRHPDTQKFRLAFRMVRLSLDVLSQVDIRNVGMPHLMELRRITSETVILSMRIDMERMTIEQIQSTLPVRGVIRLGERQPLWKGATGKAMLAYLPTTEIEEILRVVRNKKPMLATHKRINVDELRKEIQAIRFRGFAVGFGEIELAEGSIAAPILGRNDLVSGAVSIIGPELRLRTKSERLGSQVIRAARKISMELGASGGLY